MGVTVLLCCLNNGVKYNFNDHINASKLSRNLPSEAQIYVAKCTKYVLNY